MQELTFADAYTAATVILAARTSEPLRKELNASMHTVMIDCYDILREYSPLSATANGCLSALIWLRDKLGLKPIVFSRRPKARGNHSISHSQAGEVDDRGEGPSGVRTQGGNSGEQSSEESEHEPQSADPAALADEAPLHLELSNIPPSTEFFNQDSMQDLSWLDSIPFDFHFHQHEVPSGSGWRLDPETGEGPAEGPGEGGGLG